LLTISFFASLLWLQVNVESEAMVELGKGMQVARLPWFHMFRGGQQVASFTANLNTINQLRAEIAGNKPCAEPACAMPCAKPASVAVC
jgi:hypothetical protein